MQKKPTTEQGGGMGRRGFLYLAGMVIAGVVLIDFKV